MRALAEGKAGHRIPGSGQATRVLMPGVVAASRGPAKPHGHSALLTAQLLQPPRRAHLCPGNDWMNAPVRPSNTCTFLSPPPTARNAPSLLTATACSACWLVARAFLRTHSGPGASAAALLPPAAWPPLRDSPAGLGAGGAEAVRHVHGGGCIHTRIAHVRSLHEGAPVCAQQRSAHRACTAASCPWWPGPTSGCCRPWTPCTPCARQRSAPPPWPTADGRARTPTRTRPCRAGPAGAGWRRCGAAHGPAPARWRGGVRVQLG